MSARGSAHPLARRGPAAAPVAGGHPADDDLVGQVEQALGAFLAQRRAEAAAIDPAFAAAAEALVEFVLGGGKRIRPTFAWWGWRGAGGDPAGPDAAGVVDAVAALELVQACALVHDDLMDDSATRRGRPTVHVRFTREHAGAGLRGSAERFGAAVAILLGDLALVWADDLWHAADLPPAALARAAVPWRAMRTEVLGGQFLDVHTQAIGDTSVHAALQIDRYKTAAYTIERPLHLGAALAGAPEELVAAYRRFGTDLGIAFQLRDDLLGVFGDPAVTGKPAGDDLREGKRTLLLALAAERAVAQGADAALAALDAAVGDPGLDSAGVDRVRTLLDELGAPGAVEDRIAQLTASALDALDRSGVSEPAASRLAALATAATRRRR